MRKSCVWPYEWLNEQRTTRSETGKKNKMKLWTVRVSLIAAAAAGSLLALSNVSSAQDTSTNATNRAGRRGAMVEQRVDRIATELKLNEDQKAKVLALFQKEAKERRELMTDKNLARDERREKMRTLALAQNQELKTILTSGQFEKLKELRQQMRANRPRRQGRDGEPAAAPAPAPAPAPTPTPNSGGAQSQ